VAGRARSFFDSYTHDVTSGDVQRVFTRDTPEAYRYFARAIDLEHLRSAPWHRRWPRHVRLVFSAFAMRLSPGRRVLYGVALASAVLGLIMLFRGIAQAEVLVFPFSFSLPMPVWVNGTIWLVVGFVAMNLLILMEVADRLSLKGELEVARDIQLAMLPAGLRQAGDAVIFGATQPANTVGGDLYDVLDLPDGRLLIALGDVAGKGSPAALLMALLVSMLRTLADEDMPPSALASRLNAQVLRYCPASRFITLFLGVFDPRDGSLAYVNAGHLPPLIRRADGRIEKLGTAATGMALGMFGNAEYDTHHATIGSGDVLVMYSDGITEAENPSGVPHDEAGLERIISANAASDPQELGRAILAGTHAHAGDARLGDDLTVLVLRRGESV
jgi:serine phosphatase RsbU (regulator of sigma subunit)